MHVGHQGLAMSDDLHAHVRMATMADVLAVAQGGASSREFGITLNRIYFLDLKPIRLALGHTRWLAKRAIVHAVTKSCIRQQSQADDVCVQLGDEQYTLIFSSDDVERIAGTCKRIVDAVEMKLFGEKNLGRVLVRDAANVFSDGAVRKDDPPEPELRDREEGSALADNAEAQAQRKASPPPSDFSEVTREARRSKLMQLLDEEQEESLQYGYLPIWHAREGRIATYFCRPMRGRGPHADRGYDVLGNTPDAASIAQLDTHAIEECLFTLKRITEKNVRVHLMTSVHFETLANRATRTELRNLLSAVPRRYGRQLTLHLSEVPTGIPEARLSEITAALTNWTRSLAVTIKMSECPTMQSLGVRTWQFGRANIAVVGVDFDAPALEESVERAKRLASVLVPRGLRLAAMNVPTSAALCELSISDYSYLSGPAIGELEAAPSPPHAFTMRDLERAA